MILAVILSTARIACFRILASAAGCGANIRSRRIARRFDSVVLWRISRVQDQLNLQKVKSNPLVWH